MNRSSLRTRLLLAFVAVVVVSVVLVTAIATVLVRTSSTDRAVTQAVAAVESDLQLAAAQVATSSEPGTDGGPFRVLPDRALARLVEVLDPPDGTDLVIVQHGGGSNFTTSIAVGVQDVPDDLAAEVRNGLLAHVVRERAGRAELVVGGRVSTDALELYRFVDLTAVNRDLAAIVRNVALAGLVPLLLAVGAGLVAARAVLRPIGRARDVARRVTEGDLAARLEVAGTDEFAQLAEDVNEMTRSLQRSLDDMHEVVADQRRFVADVAHELRTPLTALTAAVSVLEGDHADDGADDRRARALVVAEVHALRDLVEDLMEVSRFDASVAQLQAHEVGLRGLVKGALRRRGIADTVDVDVADDLRAVVDPRRLDTVLGNLVANARTHAQPPVSVRAWANGRDLHVTVSDAGPGIPDAVRGRVFERFAKADVARSRAGGSGLGLAIARANVQLHGGTLEVADTGPDGTTMEVVLPSVVVDAVDSVEVADVDGVEVADVDGLAERATWDDADGRVES